MTSTFERTEKASPMEKFSVLATDVDSLRRQIENLTTEQSIDDLLEVVEVSELAEQFGTSLNLMRRKLSAANGKVFKLGKKYVIRKVILLEVLQRLEG